MLSNLLGSVPYFAVVVGVMTMLSCAHAAARVCTAASGPQRVAVLELYTSEGCDSCPPADKWVSDLPKTLGAERLIPLAFHVDYWNYIGWPDPYSQARFSDRQRQHSKRRGASFVFTPQLLLNGQDHRRGLLFDDIDEKVKVINRSKPLADIKLTLANNGSTLASSVEAAAKNPEQRGAQLYLALYENNLVTAVRAGENKGRTLKHDFVVRELAGPLALDAHGGVRHEYMFRLEAHWKAQDLRLAVFVQQAQSGDVLQALTLACP